MKIAKTIAQAFWKTKEGLDYIQNEETFINQIYLPAYVLSKCTRGSFNRFIDKETNQFSETQITEAAFEAYQEERNWLINQLMKYFEKKCEPSSDPNFKCDTDVTIQRYKNKNKELKYEDPFEIYACAENPTLSYMRLKQGKSCKVNTTYVGVLYFSLPHLRSTYYDLLGMKNYLNYLVKFDAHVFERYYGTDVDNFIYLPEAFVKILLTKVFPNMMKAHIQNCIKATSKQTGGTYRGGGEDKEICDEQGYSYYCGDEQQGLYKKERCVKKRDDCIRSSSDYKEPKRKDRPLSTSTQQIVEQKVSQSSDTASMRDRRIAREQALLNKAFESSIGLIDYTVDNSGGVIGKIGNVIVGTASFVGTKISNMGTKLKIIFFPPQINPYILADEYKVYNNYISDITTCCFTMKHYTEEQRKAAIEQIIDLDKKITEKKLDPLVVLKTAMIEDSQGMLERTEELHKLATKIGNAMKNMADAEEGDKYKLMSKQLEGEDAMKYQLREASRKGQAQLQQNDKVAVFVTPAKDVFKALGNMMNSAGKEYGFTQGYDDFQEYSDNFSAVPSSRQEFLTSDDPFWNQNSVSIRNNIEFNAAKKEKDLEEDEDLQKLISEQLGGGKGGHRMSRLSYSY